MEYYDDDDYVRASPGLTPFQPDLNNQPPLPFTPLWLPQDINEAPLSYIHVEHAGDGREARQKLYKSYKNEAPQHEWEFMDSLLLHQMAPTNPQLTLKIGLSGRIECGSSSDGSLSDERDNLYLDSFAGAESKSQASQTPLPSDRKPMSPLPPLLTDHEPTSPLPPPHPSITTRRHRPRKPRLGLPITIHKQGVLATVLACADTGADVNIISDEVAKTLGYSEYDALPEKKEFALANGKLVEAIGMIESVCSFGIETESLLTMTCAFYVLLKAATPIIMGLSFLEQTKTMTEHRERLVRVPTPALQALSVCSIDKPRWLLSCELNHRETLATPDSGSEIDLISPSFAAERGLTVYPGEEAIQMADGSIAITAGFVRVDMAVASINTSSPKSHEKSFITVDLLLLDSLSHDLIVSEDSLEELQVFTEHSSALIPAPQESGPLGINRIRHLGAIDRIVSWVKKMIRGSSSRDDDDAATNTSPSSHRIDQRENHRRELEAARIATLPVDEQQAAITAEAATQEAYAVRNRVMTRSNILDVAMFSPQHIPNSMTGSFQCDYPGCTALPFQTQYLLNSHTNVHSSPRPHYCPVKDCPRGEGGKGFKRKNEMIRHGLIHQVPGYICPYCPRADREYKYPRPDNLQRHVRVHHTDKDKDDPLLRDVLAQRPEGGSRGRRRRVDDFFSS